LGGPWGESVSGGSRVQQRADRYFEAVESERRAKWAGCKESRGRKDEKEKGMKRKRQAGRRREQVAIKQAHTMPKRTTSRPERCRGPAATLIWLKVMYIVAGIPQRQGWCCPQGLEESDYTVKVHRKYSVPTTY
jgi:hypothetical protein